MRKSILILAVTAVAGLAGCMQNGDLERAAYGAVLGCVAGEIISNGQCVTGAAIGAAGGALANDI